MQYKILYIQYTNPGAYPPLHHSSRILAEDNWEVLFLGTVGLGGNALALRFPPHPNITVRLMPFCPGGWQQKLHYLRYSVWVIFWVLRWQPQWVYASDLLSCPVAMLLSLLPGIKVIYHEHDSPSLASNSFFIKLCLVARKWLANRAKICILPNQQRVENFTSEVGSNSQVVCVWNCPSLEEVSSLRLPLSGDELWVLYHGNIGRSLIPPTVLSALAMLPEPVKLRAIGYQTLGHENYIQELKEIANQLGIRDRIEFLPAMPRSELLKWCQKCDVGIAFMPKSSSNVNFQHMVGASNKAFDYLACGLPLLVSDLPDWKQMYVEPGYGLVCNPEAPDSIAAVLNWYLEHPTQMREMGELGRLRIVDEWNYEEQFSPVWKQMKLENASNLSLYRLRFTSLFMRFLPPGIPGKTRLAKLLLGSCLQAKNVQISARYDCNFLVPCLREPVGFYLFIDGVYEIKAIDFLLSRLQQGSVFVDIGANIGAFTLPAAQKIGSTGCVLAIEPSPSIFPYLKKNVNTNSLSNIHLIQCAAFDKDTQILFYEAPEEHFGMGSLAAQFHARPISVPAQTLDNILRQKQIKRVDSIKVDVEGFEAAVFRGAEELLTGDNPPLILFEFCDWAEARVPGGKVGDAQRVLQQWGYRIWRLADFIHGKPPLHDVLTNGFETLIASKA